MAETSAEPREYEIFDEQTPGRDRARTPVKKMLESKGWQAFSIKDNVVVDPEAGSRINFSNKRYANVGINIYPPGRKDEMHCHPGSEHIFMVIEGELHVYGINEGEDVVLRKGELVHINQSYFYQLSNESDELCVLYGVFTKPPKPPKKTRYSYRGPKETVDPASLEGE
jgi:mannose-6-phosphate isomerase-like protein (cupin superfamily)